MNIKSVIATLVAAVALTFAPTSQAGQVNGPSYNRDRVLPHSSDSYNIRITPGTTVIVVNGDDDTDLDCFVWHDGEIIARDIDSTDACVMSVTSDVYTNITIQVKNLGDVYNVYEIRTN